jgi:hypothetical protein
MQDSFHLYLEINLLYTCIYMSGYTDYHYARFLYRMSLFIMSSYVKYMTFYATFSFTIYLMDEPDLG